MRIMMYAKSLETTVFDRDEFEIAMNDVDSESLLREITDKYQLKDILAEYDFETIKEEYEKIKQLQNAK